MHAGVVVDHGQDAGRHPVEPPQAADQVGALLAVEDGVEHVDGVQVSPDAVEIAVDAAGDERGVAAEVGEVRAEGAVFEDGGHGGLGGVAHIRAVVLWAGAVGGGQGGGPEPDELELPVEAHDAEQAPGDGVVEGLGQLHVAPVRHELDVAALGVDPGLAGAGGRQPDAAGVHGVEHRGGVQVQSLGGVLAVTVPVAGPEAPLGPGGDGDEVAVERLEALVEDAGQLARRARTAGRAHGGRLQSPAAPASVASQVVVADHLVDHEPQELLAEGRVEVRRGGQVAQPGNLLLLALAVGGRQADARFVDPDLLGDLEALREQQDQRGVDVVDARPVPGQRLVGSTLAHR